MSPSIFPLGFVKKKAYWDIEGSEFTVMDTVDEVDSVPDVTVTVNVGVPDPDAVHVGFCEVMLENDPVAPLTDHE